MSSIGPSGPAPDRRMFRRIYGSGGGEVDPSRWPATVPAVAQILASGLELPAGVTVLTGENGTGKSTVVELIAEACGLNPQGGSAKTTFQTRGSEPGIGEYLWAERGPGYPAWSYFLRADTMHGLYTYLEENPGRRPERFHELSHGEGFLKILRTRINQPGFYLMDEPDAPLSFVASLSLVALLQDLGEAGAQVVVATHSPVVAAVPGARILELGSWGIRPAQWDELELVANWRQFLSQPQSFLRHL
ncbi:MAG TPA: AAA family ATPase [Streptosporangiaceae bacterium]|nr:AAA family ATPase [Streptosporangiaceae bacterium]